MLFLLDFKYNEYSVKVDVILGDIMCLETCSHVFRQACFLRTYFMKTGGTSTVLAKCREVQLVAWWWANNTLRLVPEASISTSLTSTPQYPKEIRFGHSCRHGIKLSLKLSLFPLQIIPILLGDSSLIVKDAHVGFDIPFGIRLLFGRPV